MSLSIHRWIQGGSRGSAPSRTPPPWRSHVNAKKMAAVDFSLKLELAGPLLGEVLDPPWALVS